jgi:hypothetical protein
VDEGGTTLFRSTDADEVSAYCGTFFLTHRISHLGNPRSFGFSLYDMPLGPVRISEISYEEDAAIQLGGLRSSYSFFLPVRGFVTFEHRKSPVVIDPSLGLVIGPREPINLTHWSAHTKALLVWFEEDALENEIAAMLGRSVRGTVSFQPQVRTGAPGPGRVDRAGAHRAPVPGSRTAFIRVGLVVGQPAPGLPVGDPARISGTHGPLGQCRLLTDPARGDRLHRPECEPAAHPVAHRRVLQRGCPHAARRIPETSPNHADGIPPPHPPATDPRACSRGRR